MKYPAKYLLLLTFVAALVAGCRKDSTNQTDITIPPDPTIKIQTGAMGFVVDESGAPVKDATVLLDNNQVQTDQNGYFSLTGLSNQAQPFVRVEKAGYFPSLSSFSTNLGDMGRVKVTLRNKTLAGQIDAGAGGVVIVPGGGFVDFAVDGFVDASGQLYSGSVMVYATYLDPSQPQTDNMVPASWQARNAAGEAQVLLSYGMIHALLETPAGDKLQLAKPAKIIVPVPADRLSSAPSNIPLWYIDETTSLWKEEGSAVLQGSAYKGEVSHFSWWNCDDGFPIVKLSGTLRIGDTYPFAEIRVTRTNGATASTTPSATGFFCGSVPANETLLFEVINECGDIVYSENIGPFSVNTDIGIISLNWNTDWVEISGILLDCDQQPVSSGYVSAWTDNQASGNFPIVIDPADGSFSGAIANCGGTEVSLVGYDLDALKSSETLTQAVAPQVGFGNVVACDVQITSGILFEFNGTEKFIEDATVVLDGPTPNMPATYTVEATDDQGAGNKTIYKITLLDWNQNPADPIWAMSIENILFGQPVYYQAETQNGTIEALQIGTMPGELVIFKVTDVVIQEYPSNNIYQNGTMTITAVVQ